MRSCEVEILNKLNSTQMIFFVSGSMKNWLVVSTHLKNVSQNGNLPQLGVKKKYLKPPPSDILNSTQIFFVSGSKKKNKAPKILAFLASPFASSNASWKVLSWLSPDVRKLQRSTCVDMILFASMYGIFTYIYHIPCLAIEDR